MTLSLKADPDWQASASALISGCHSLDDVEQRVRLLEQLADKLGDQLYPAFIHILCIISARGDRRAKSLLTEALIKALQSGRIPSGKLAAWGAMQVLNQNHFGQVRSLGPIEYLCAWYAQPTGDGTLSKHGFRVAVGYLIKLFDMNTTAKQLYCTKMLADLQDPLGGALSKGTQTAMLKFVETWRHDLSAEKVINAYLDELSSLAHNRLSGMNGVFSYSLSRTV